MFVGSVAGSVLPGSTGQPVAGPPLDVAGPDGAPVVSSGTVTLGAAAPEAVPAPISLAQPELVTPSIHPPPLRERARPLDAGPVISAAAVVAQPAPAGRSAPVTALPSASGDAQTPAPQPSPPAGAEEPVEQPAPEVPGDEAPGDEAPDGGAPQDGGPGDGDGGAGGEGGTGGEGGAGGDSGTGYGTRDDGRGPGSSTARDEATPATTSNLMIADDSASPADQDGPQRGSGDAGGRHRR